MESQITEPKPRLFIEIIESMRGVASLGVVCYHFSNGTMPTLVPNSFGSFFEWARLGIPLFFIISAFIIPYSMYTAGYTIRNAGTYLLKRMTRMAPPAWIAIVIIFGIYYGAVALKGSPITGMTWPGVSLKALFANLFFSFVLFDVDKYIEVYWTLEVEFQFYILIALLLPLILKFRKNTVVLSGIFIAMSCSYFFHGERILFFKYNSYFILGILLFLYRMNLIRRNYFIYASCLAAIACYVQIGVTAACASTIGIMLIALVKFQNPVTDFLGMISYSLYITHHSTGVLAEYILRNVYGMQPSEPVKFVMFFVYLGLAILVGWIFFKIFEEPFHRISKQIPMNRKKR